MKAYKLLNIQHSYIPNCYSYLMEQLSIYHTYKMQHRTVEPWYNDMPREQ